MAGVTDGLEAPGPEAHGDAAGAMTGGAATCVQGLVQALHGGPTVVRVNETPQATYGVPTREPWRRARSLDGLAVSVRNFCWSC